MAECPKAPAHQRRFEYALYLCTVFRFIKSRWTISSIVVYLKKRMLLWQFWTVYLRVVWYPPLRFTRAEWAKAPAYQAGFLDLQPVAEWPPPRRKRCTWRSCFGAILNGISPSCVIPAPHIYKGVHYGRMALGTSMSTWVRIRSVPLILSSGWNLDLQRVVEWPPRKREAFAHSAIAEGRRICRRPQEGGGVNSEAGELHSCFRFRFSLIPRLVKQWGDTWSSKRVHNLRSPLCE